jgi:hypothetical protein
MIPNGRWWHAPEPARERRPAGHGGVGSARAEIERPHGILRSFEGGPLLTELARG